MEKKYKEVFFFCFVLFFVYLFVCLFVCLFVGLFVCLLVCLFFSFCFTCYAVMDHVYPKISLPQLLQILKGAPKIHMKTSSTSAA